MTSDIARANTGREAWRSAHLPNLPALDQEGRVYRIDPSTGDRVELAAGFDGLPTASAAAFFSLATVPPPGPASVSSFTDWALPLLLGALLGISIKQLGRAKGRALLDIVGVRTLH